MSGHPYISSDDSALLRGALSGFSGGACLEIGAGNAGTLVELRRRFPLVVGTDIVHPAMGDWTVAGADFVLADKASCFRAGSFDLVAFNPPYLGGAAGDRAVDGGEGFEVPLAFLEEALRAVKATGSVVWLLNGEADRGPFERLCTEAGFSVDMLRSERLFFEELTVYVASGRHGGRRARHRKHPSP